MNLRFNKMHCKTGQEQAQRDLLLHVLVQDASMRGAVVIECVRDKVRHTDSDYVMRKPSRCWLGAVPRYYVERCGKLFSFHQFR